jgi:hypothetical protein
MKAQVWLHAGLLGAGFMFVVPTYAAADKPTDSEVQREKDMAEWPDGWIVLDQEQMAPVLDELGRQLHAARRSFQASKRTEAASEVRQGAKFLAGEVSDARPEAKKALKGAVTDLRRVADQLETKKPMTQAQLDAAFAEAYRADLTHAWVFRSEREVAPYMESPQEHYKEALREFKVKHPTLAAHEVRKAAAFFRLQAMRAEAPEARSRLDEAVTRLDRLATRLEKGKVRSPKELDNEFNEVEELRQGREFEGWEVQPIESAAPKTEPGR